MVIQHLEYILEVANSGSINKAAQNLYLSQPYLSSIIQKVEAEAGYPVFWRTRSGIRPTKEGEYFLESARTIVHEMENILKVPERFGKNNLTVSFAYSISAFGKLLKFENTLPTGAKPDNFHEMDNESVIKEVLEGAADLGIILFSDATFREKLSYLEQHDIEIILLESKISLGVWMDAKHPLAKKENLSRQDLKRYKQVYFHCINNSEAENIVKISEEENGISVTDRGSYLEALHDRRCYAIRPLPTSFYAANRYGLVCRAVSEFESTTVSYYLIRRRNNPKSKREIDLIEWILESFGER